MKISKLINSLNYRLVNPTGLRAATASVYPQTIRGYSGQFSRHEMDILRAVKMSLYQDQEDEEDKCCDEKLAGFASLTNNGEEKMVS